MMRRFLYIPVWAALVAMVLMMSACSDSGTETKAVSGVTDFIKTDVVVGQGEEAIKGKTVTVHYTGWLYDELASDNKGKKFDSSHDRAEPFEFPLGAGRVIKGWDQGVAGMREGGKRTLVIPSTLGYGARGAGRVIPPHATLIFDVALLDVR